MLNVTSAKGRLANDPKFFPHKDESQQRAWGIIVWSENNSLQQIPFSVFGKKAKIITDYCRKGKEILVQGELSYDKKTGYKEILVHTIHLGRDAPTTVQKTWTMREAYEANKTSTLCVVCGKELNMHPSVGVLYCKCVEDL